MYLLKYSEGKSQTNLSLIIYLKLNIIGYLNDAVIHSRITE